MIKTSSGGNLEVDFPDGKTLYVTPQWWASQSEWYLNVDVTHLGLVSGRPGVIPARNCRHYCGRELAAGVAKRHIGGLCIFEVHEFPRLKPLILRGNLSSGPGGRRFKSSLPDQGLTTMYSHLPVTKGAAKVLVSWMRVGSPRFSRYAVKVCTFNTE